LTDTPEPGAASIGSRGRVALQRFGSSAVVLLVGLAVTASAAFLQHHAHVSEARQEFSAWCAERQERLTRAIDSHVEVLYGLRALFDASEQVNLEEFGRYARVAVERHPYLRSIGLLRPVTDSQRPAFEAHYSQVFGRRFVIVDAQPQGGFITAPSRAEYLPFVYMVRSDGVPSGLDALREQSMSALLEVLRENDSARALISDVPGEDGTTRRAVQIYLAVHQPHSRSEQPADTPYGYVRARFVLDEVLADTARDAMNAGIEQRIVLAQEGSDVDSTGVNNIASSDGLLWTDALTIADQTLQLQLRATDRYAGHPRFLSTWPLLVGGACLTLLGTATAFFLAGSRMRLQQLAQSLLEQMRERQLSEQRTAQSEARYRVLVENSPDSILLYRQQHVVFANRAAIELFRASSAADLLGRGVLELVHPDFHEMVNARMDLMQRYGTPLPTIEQRLVRLDGSTVEVEVRTVPFMSDGEQLLQVAIRDIGDRRRAERERAGLEAALRQSQRLEAIGTLTGGIAHDFNNILSSIVGNIQLVLVDLPASHPARQSAHEIRKATNRARDLVKRLMTFSREQEAPKTSIEVAPLVEEVQQLLRPTLPAGVELKTTIPFDAPPVMADATQLHQVLVNLCTNAAQAMTDGQGRIDIIVTTLSALEATARSKTTLDASERYLCFEVRDNGQGIEPEIADRIFEPFFTTKSAGEGSGLGLAVVHGIVHSHKGAIVMHSRVGQGTSFCVYLPASEAPVQSSPAQQEVSARGDGQHILYVDDEEPLVFLVTRVLERSGYHCTGTTEARHAVDLVRRNPQQFDLVLSDMNMPGMSGLDVAREVLSIRPDLPIVITTGYVRATDVAAARVAGVRDLMLKPDTIEELPVMVNRYLETHARSE
jgi:PAS domain S-box-containing protein